MSMWDTLIQLSGVILYHTAQYTKHDFISNLPIKKVFIVLCREGSYFLRKCLNGLKNSLKNI